MTSILILAAFAACGTGAVFALLLARPLFKTLGDSCSSGQSAGFWTAYSIAMLVLAPGIGVLFLGAFPGFGLKPEVMFARSLFYGLICLILALLVIGRVMGRTAFKQLDAEIKKELLISTKEGP